jgi:hypothetical protein
MILFSAFAGETPLFSAAFFGGAAAARYLIDHGADPLAGKTWSPLHGAAAKGLSLSQEVYLEPMHSSHILGHTQSLQSFFITKPTSMDIRSIRLRKGTGRATRTRGD